MAQPRVILLHNFDNSWTAQDIVETAEDRRIAIAALQAHGFEVAETQVFDSVARSLATLPCPPSEWFVFNWCEGYADRPWDYAGVTRELDGLGYIYSGASTDTLEATQDKQGARAKMQAAGVPVPLGQVVHAVDDVRWEVFPAIVKPVNQHGSYGIDEHAVVFDAAALRQRVAHVFTTFDSPALIEEFIDGRELLVTVWGNRPQRVFPPVEVVFGAATDPRGRVYSYDLKFHLETLDTQRVGFICPTMLAVDALARLEDACVRAFAAVGCRDYLRLDVRVRDDQPYIIDVNTNPDINSESMVMIAAGAAGLTYAELIAQIAQMTHARWLAQRAS